MKTNRLRGWALLCLAGLPACAGWGAETTATVKSGKVNVRGQASLSSERITQLNKGETVTVLEEISVKKPKKGEPSKWVKIQLPANTPVWVFAPYIESTNKTVNVKRLNLRGGPGENFSVLGRLERGTPVKEIRVDKNWMEIEAPTNAYAFVAAEYLEPAPTAEAPALAAAPAVAPPPTTVETVQTEPPVATAVEEQKAAPPAVTPPPETEPKPAVTPEPAPVAEAPKPVEPPPKRTVSREGIVIVARSIQSPTAYALESRDTHRTINYLHSEEVGLKLKNFAGRKVIVTGEELLDARWTKTPIIEVETIQIVP